MRIPDDLAFEVTIYPEAPAGAPTGTFAAVTVALIGGLDSLTLLCGARSDVKRAMIRAIEAENPLYRHIPTYLSRYGLQVWKSASASA